MERKRKLSEGQRVIAIRFR